MISISQNAQAKQLFEALHNRPFPRVNEDKTVSHFVMLGGEREAELAHLQALQDSHSALDALQEDGCLYLETESFSLRWERHTEFSSYTIMHAANGREPFSYMATHQLDSQWLDNIPGQVITAVNVELRQQPLKLGPDPELKTYFDQERLVASSAFNNRARLWSAFRLHGDGFGRYFIQTDGCNPCEVGRLLRTVLELETYRAMAMLALPEALELLPKLQQKEASFAEIIDSLNMSQDYTEQQQNLAHMAQINADNEHLIASTNYRFSAASAYYEIVLGRLQELQESDVQGLVSIGGFIQRRMQPAMKTCNAVRERMLELSNRLDNASELLRTQINIDMQNQQKELLHVMNERARLSLMLQKTVEGMSVIIISYYLINLLKPYIKAATDALLPSLPQASALPMLAPILVFALVWVFIHRSKKMLGEIK